METIVYEIELNDGRVFRVFCGNAKQKKEIHQSYNQIKEKVRAVRTVTTGIHTVNQYKELIKTF